MYTATKEENIANLKNSAQNLKGAANDAAKDVANEASRSLYEVAGKAGRKVRDFVHTTEDELVQARDTVTKQIRNKPVQSSVVALGLGLVLGALLRR